MACQFIDDEWMMQVFKVVRFAPYKHSALVGAEEVCLEMAEGVRTASGGSSFSS